MVTRFYGLVGQTPVVRTAHARVIEGTLSLGISRGRGLDLGTGPGNVAVELARRLPGLQMVGLDLAAHMVEMANRQSARAGLDGRGLWLHGDGHELPFADDSFDLVVSSFSLHHWEHPLHILNEIARVLRRPDPEKGIPTGRYHIADVCREVNLFQRLFAYASIPAVSLPLGSYWRYGGYYESVRAGYTRDEARQLLEQSNLPVAEITVEPTWFVPVLSIRSRDAN
jgi:ubiquinone/menaquinone biosynthesis C-methylase UbiE